MASTPTTQRENLSRHNGTVPKVDSPAVSARARARIATTQRDSNRERQTGRRLAAWWAWTAQPASLNALWQASSVDPKRIPAANLALRWACHASNWTDRLLMFAIIALLPTFATGPLRWCAERPTRRYGLYLTLAALTAAYLIGA